MNDNSSLHSCGLTVLRVVVGVVFTVHGYQKLFVMGFSGVSGFLGSLGIPVPAVAAVVVTLLELVGGVALVAGLMTRWIALLLAVDMAVAILVYHGKNGFFVPKGYEFVLLLMAASIALALAGPGAASVDGAIAKRN